MHCLRMVNQVDTPIAQLNNPLAEFSVAARYTMPVNRLIRNVLLSIFCSLAAAVLAVAQAAAPVWEVSVYGGNATAAGPSAAQIAAKPAADFTPFDPKVVYATGLQKHVWLRVRMSSEQEIPADAWLVGISKAFADTVVMHTRQNDGTWSSQAAGDWLAHRLWPVNSLEPQFFLPAQSAGSQDIYLEVRNRTPLRFDVTLLTARAAKTEAQNNFFFIGLPIGLMMLMVVASAVLAIAYQNTVYVWYGIYVVTNMFVCLAYSGIGAYALWPAATNWPELTITVFYMLGNMLQLQFCRAMFFTERTPLWAERAVQGILALGFVSIALSIYAIANFGSPFVFTTHVLIFSSLSFIIIARQFSLKSPASWLYLLSCLPLTVVGWLAVLEHGGWMVLAWLPYNAPIYAFGLEMPVLFAAIYVHAKAQHGETVRKSTLANTDPLTGFVSSSQYMSTFEQALDKARNERHDLVVAYVQVQHQPDHMQTIGGLVRAQSAERAVRLLRTVVRDQDTVAHVDTDLFAVLMPGLSLGEDTTNRLARLVGLALMTDQDAARHAPMRFRIAASSKRSFRGKSSKLHASLKRMLGKSDWGLRAIRYVSDAPSRQSQNRNSPPQETVSQFE